TLQNVAPHRRAALVMIASNTGAAALGDRLITLSTSPVAVCRSSASVSCFRASSRSRVRRAVSVSWSVVAERGPGTVLGGTERFCVAALRRCALIGLPPALERRRIAPSTLRTRHRSGSKYHNDSDRV